MTTQTLARTSDAPVRRTVLPFFQPDIGQGEIDEVVDTLRSGWITTGPKTKKFEQHFAEYTDTRHAVAVNSCTGGMHVALAAAGIGPGDEVIVPTMTFCATANVVVHLGATPVLVDVEPDTLNISPQSLAAAITRRTKAVMPVHLYGHPCDMEAIRALARAHNLLVVEDAAHAVGAEWRGRRIGSLSPATVFSFYATKNLTTAEGGMITTDDDGYAREMRTWVLHGMSHDAWKRYGGGSWYYEVGVPGFKYNLTDLQAALGLHQLERLEAMLQRRAQLAAIYRAGLGDLDEIELPAERRDVRHAWHLYAIRLRLERLDIDRAAFIERLKDEGISTSVHFPFAPPSLLSRSFRPSAAGFPRGRCRLRAPDLVAPLYAHVRPGCQRCHRGRAARCPSPSAVAERGMTMAKRMLDIVVAAVGLLVLAPLMIVIAILIVLDSPGGVFFKGKRVGQYGKIFYLYKFRSMVADAPSRGASITSKGDPRVTRIGRVLRKTKLDELPNLINVLKGEMSLVGPRPEAPDWVARYTEQQRAVLNVKPGITGLAQIKYRNEEELLSAGDLETTYLRIMNDKLAIDLDYVAHRSLGLDLRILWETGAPLWMRLANSAGPRALYLRRILLDLALIPCAFYLAWLVRFDGRVPASEWKLLGMGMPAIVGVYVLSNLALGVYRYLWAYANFHDALLLCEAAGVSTGVLVMLNFALSAFHRSRPSTGGLVIGGLFMLGLSALVKYRRQILMTFLAGRRRSRSPNCERMLIVGVNEAAQYFATEVYAGHFNGDYELVGLIDREPRRKGLSVNGLTILGTTEQIQAVVRAHDVDVIVIAERPADREAMWRLVAACRETQAQVKILPDIVQCVEGSYQDPLALRDVSIDDILGRTPVATDAEACRRILADKVVLVTGAAGSIGSELCRQILTYKPRALLALDNNESGLYELNLEINADGSAPLHLLLADVADRERMGLVFEQHAPQVVFHAAAYKHVPLMESHPDEALRTNVVGTLIVSELAHAHGAERFVLISTDKAVNPSSVMGASKRIGERWIKAMSEYSQTIFTAVRFGNVMYSRGSVLPVFARQIEMGGPVTVTHPQMYRFFISIPEAVSLVLQAASFSHGGDIFMLDMGDEVSILALAERMIRLKGLRMHKDIEIKFTGIRPGEKLHEELAYGDEIKDKTPHPRIYSLQSLNGAVDRDELRDAILFLNQCRSLPDGAQVVRDGMFQLALRGVEGFVVGMAQAEQLQEWHQNLMRRASAAWEGVTYPAGN